MSDFFLSKHGLMSHNAPRMIFILMGICIAYILAYILKNYSTRIRLFPESPSTSRNEPRCRYERTGTYRGVSEPVTLFNRSLPRSGRSEVPGTRNRVLPVQTVETLRLVYTWRGVGPRRTERRTTKRPTLEEDSSPFRSRGSTRPRNVPFPLGPSIVLWSVLPLGAKQETTLLYINFSFITFTAQITLH